MSLDCKKCAITATIIGELHGSFVYNCTVATVVKCPKCHNIWLPIYTDQYPLSKSELAKVIPTINQKKIIHRNR